MKPSIRPHLVSQIRVSPCVALLVFALASPARAEDAGDEYANNLFSDLAPLIALFGEQFARQFMSESMSWLDNIIFAMAPLGIITAIVGAIRVGGPSWLKAIVGRARENIAAAEIELMSSTSHEVGELWNGQAIVRTVGTPEVAQILFLENDVTEGTFGLHTLKTAEKAGMLVKRRYSGMPTLLRKMLNKGKGESPYLHHQAKDNQSVEEIAAGEELTGACLFSDKMSER